MSEKSDAELLAQAEEIKDETIKGANTAERVGQLFVDIVDSKKSKAGSGGGLVRWNFSSNGGLFPTDPDTTYVATDSSVYPENTQFYSMTDTLPEEPDASNFYTK